MMGDPHGILEWIQHLDRYVARIEETLGPRRQVLASKDFDDLIEHNALRALESGVAVAEFTVLYEGWEHWPNHVALFLILKRRNVVDAELAERIADAMRFLTIARKEFQRLDVCYITKNADLWARDLTQFADQVLAKYDLERYPPDPDDE